MPTYPPAVFPSYFSGRHSVRSTRRFLCQNSISNFFSYYFFLEWNDFLLDYSSFFFNLCLCSQWTLNMSCFGLTDKCNQNTTHLFMKDCPEIIKMCHIWTERETIYFKSFIFLYFNVFFLTTFLIGSFFYLYLCLTERKKKRREQEKMARTMLLEEVICQTSVA